MAGWKGYMVAGCYIASPLDQKIEMSVDLRVDKLFYATIYLFFYFLRALVLLILFILVGVRGMVFT